MFNEREVVSDILRGNIKSFEQLVKQYEKLVFYVVNRMVTQAEDTEDICQEVFIKVHKNLYLFQFQSRLSTWIARIAYLTAVNHLKKYKNEKLNGQAEDLENHYITDDNPEVLFVRKDISVYINNLIAQLPVHYRTVLTLYHLNEFSCREIEEITGISGGTIKSSLYRARKILKDKMKADLKGANMKELNDEDLQRMLEEGNRPGKDNLSPAQKDDLEAYHLLFSELKRPPEVHLPYNFAANVAAAVISKKHRLSILFFYLLAIGVAIAGITGSYILLLMLNQPFALHLSAIILPYKWLIIFGVLSLLLIQYTDQKLIKEPKGMV